MVHSSAPAAEWWFSRWCIGSCDDVAKGKSNYMWYFITFLVWYSRCLIFFWWWPYIWFVQNSPTDVVKAVYDTCFDSAVRIVLQTDDHSELQVFLFLLNAHVVQYFFLKFPGISSCFLSSQCATCTCNVELTFVFCNHIDQNATECLAYLLAVAKQQVLAWGGDPGFTMRSLLDVASRWFAHSLILHILYIVIRNSFTCLAWRKW